jgi:hypothetical protein
LKKTEVHKETSYFVEASRIFYHIALVVFIIGMSLNQPDYFKNSRWYLIFTDIASFILIYSFFVLYLFKKISFHAASFIYIYTTLVNLSVSTWLYYYYDIDFTGNFLFNTIIYCINIVGAGFCIGRKHVYLTSVLYTASLCPLIFISNNQFLIRNSFTIVFLIFAFSLAVSGFLRILQRSYSQELALKEEIIEKDKAIAEEQQNRFNSDIEAKSKEITAKKMFLLEYAKNNDSFIKKLNSLKKGMKSNEIKLLNNIIQQHTIDHHENYWKEFESSFLALNPFFYKKLHSICPDLTPTEAKLAALIHMRLSSKQIGKIISNTPQSIDVARSRIRSKLKLPAEANLKAFLINI